MVAKLYKFLAKIGLSESEQSFVVRVVIVSTAVCVSLVVVFWAMHFFTPAPEEGDAGRMFGRADADIVAPEIGGLDIEAHEFTARRHMQTGRADAAVPHLLRIIATRRGERAAFDALDALVTAYIELGEFSDALSAIDNLRSTFADYDLSEIEQSLQVRRGIALYHLREFGQSSEILLRVLEDNPNNASALTFMGQMEAAAMPGGRSLTAERFFRRAIEADPAYAEGWYQFARYFENNGDYRSAREFLLKVLEKEPLNVRAHARLGMVYYYKLEADMALKSYQTALALNPFDYNTRHNLGELYRTLFQDNENALREFVRAIDINPQHAEANYRAGLICAGNGMFKEAIRYFEAALRNDRRNAGRLLQLAAAYERLGDREAALSVYREVTDVDPLNSIAIQKIRFLEMEGN
ncbi:MAG: tetratricopeptide repeat protein [Chitinispirillales bacterium]|jgi:tetratricopeptide (TPR) repeat protein|nr:tetratricopeptide repeat protein [Chitinispirillales bacterium]